MKPLNEILAKSANYGNVPLLDHTQHVVDAISRFANGFVHNFDTELACKGAILHDLGKAHPHFQRKVYSIKAKSSFEKFQWDYVHRHEISSLAFLPLFPKSDWNKLIDLIVSHHKSIENDANGKGILDLKANGEDWLNNHLRSWDEWNIYGFAILDVFNIETKNISEAEAREALIYAADYCKYKTSGWSAFRGLLKAADHFASAFNYSTNSQLQHLFEKPDLSYYLDPDRMSSLYPLSSTPHNDPRQHTMVIASTGAGKTDFLLKRCKGRIFYTLPFQASINAMYERLKKTVPNKDIRLLHGTSKIVKKESLDEKILQPLVGSSIKVLTPHQLASMIFCTSGYETIMLDVQGTDVILDEIHTYSDYSQAMVIEILKLLKWLNCRIHIGTATMPSALYKELLEILGGESFVYQVKLSDNEIEQFDRHQVYKIKKEEVNGILEAGLKKNEKILLICNTVQAAQDAFENLKFHFKGVPIMLIHSRFRRIDRVNLERELMNTFNGDGFLNEGLKPCVVVSTQVVEVSLDISFDRMVTECAPLDGLIQRFGRVNRKRSQHTIGKYKPVHVIVPGGGSLPYKKEIIKASYDQLPDNGELLKERSLQKKIDAVYPKIDKKQIDIHLKFKDNRFLQQELTDNKRAILIEALEIASATCILESDRDEYLSASLDDRLYLEIPVNWKTMMYQKETYEQLTVGSHPFVVRQEVEEHKIMGLKLVTHDTIW